MKLISGLQLKELVITMSFGIIAEYIRTRLAFNWKEEFQNYLPSVQRNLSAEFKNVCRRVLSDSVPTRFATKTKARREICPPRDRPGYNQGIKFHPFLSWRERDIPRASQSRPRNLGADFSVVSRTRLLIRGRTPSTDRVARF